VSPSRRAASPSILLRSAPSSTTWPLAISYSPEHFRCALIFSASRRILSSGSQSPSAVHRQRGSCGRDVDGAVGPQARRAVLPSTRYRYLRCCVRQRHTAK
jgi:hypothetical protein